MAMGLWGRTARKCLILVDQVLGRLYWQASRRHFRTDYIIRKWEGARDLKTAKKIAVLVHFSTDPIFAEYFVYLLRALDDAGFVTVVVSNSKKLDGESVRSILPWCGKLLHRKNIGYDFGAWRDGISSTPEIADAEQLLIANDSVFGPFHNLGGIVERCRFDQADVWGMTDSFDGRYHLQSYFVLFGPKALRSAAFAKFWRGVRYVAYKNVVIYKFEIGLSRALLKSGLKLKALYPYRRLSKGVVSRTLAVVAEDAPRPHRLHEAYFERLLQSVNAGHPLNPTHHFWEYLIAECGFPFIKRELLEKNPVGIPLLANWTSVIEDVSDYPVALIEDYLQTTTRNRIF